MILVGGNWNMNFMTCHSVGNFIIPTDEVIFHQPPTSNSSWLLETNTHTCGGPPCNHKKKWGYEQTKIRTNNKHGEMNIWFNYISIVVIVCFMSQYYTVFYSFLFYSPLLLIVAYISPWYPELPWMMYQIITSILQFAILILCQDCP